MDGVSVKGACQRIGNPESDLDLGKFARLAGW